MNETTRAEIVKFAKTLAPDAKVADLGSYNINGAVKDIIPQAVGFDIVEGPGVDVLIEEHIPDAHLWQYDVLTAVGAFQCADPERFKSEMLGLLKVDGRFLLVSCAVGCSYRHTTSVATRDSHRWWPETLAGFLRPEFEIEYTGETNHPECVITGRKR